MDIYASKLSPALDIGVGMFLFVTAVLSIVGNGLVLIMAYRRSSSMKPPEMLSVNLAVTDLGAAISMYPLAAASAWNHHWLGGDATCVYYGLVGFFFGTASIMNLTVMAIVRFVVSANQLPPSDRISRQTVKILCAWVWLYALFWALLPIIGCGRYGPEHFGISCSLAWEWMSKDGFTFIVIMFVFNLALPSLIIFSCYFGISLKLYCTYRNCSRGGLQLPNIVKMNRRLLIIAVLISGGFVVSWTPYGMVSLWRVLRSEPLPPEVTLLPCMFAKSSTFYNPLIYYTFSQRFKREVKELGAMCTSNSRPSRLCHPSVKNSTDNRVYIVSDHNDQAMVIGNTQLLDRIGCPGDADVPEKSSSGTRNVPGECDRPPRTEVRFCAVNGV